MSGSKHAGHNKMSIMLHNTVVFDGRLW